MSSCPDLARPLLGVVVAAVGDAGGVRRRPPRLPSARVCAAASTPRKGRPREVPRGSRRLVGHVVVLAHAAACARGARSNQDSAGTTTLVRGAVVGQRHIRQRLPDAHSALMVRAALRRGPVSPLRRGSGSSAASTDVDGARRSGPTSSVSASVAGAVHQKQHDLLVARGDGGIHQVDRAVARGVVAAGVRCRRRSTSPRAAAAVSANG